MSETDSQWLERQDHPLLNSLVLGKVFTHLSGVDLMECRLVCKAWNIYTIPFIRNAFVVTIHRNTWSRIHTIENFVEVFRSNQLGIPFAKFKLWPFCTTEGAGQEFLQLCGETAQSFQFDDERYMVEDVSELLRTTPKLEVFDVPLITGSRSGNVVKLFPECSKPRLTSLKRLTVWHDDPKERNQYCPTFLEELLVAAENISSLTLHDMRIGILDPICHSDGMVCRNSDMTCYLCNMYVLDVLRHIEKMGRESCIQELEIYVPLFTDSEYVEILRKMTTKPRELKLKRFVYDTCKYEYWEKTNWLLEFFTHTKDTLEYLTVGQNVTTNFMNFPKFNCLKVLSMKLPEDFTSRSINLKMISPVLVKLDIHSTSSVLYEWDSGRLEIDEFFPQSDPCPTVKTFQPFDVDFDINAFNQILFVFPNLTNLRVHITLDGAEILRQIWSQMTQLETLSIYGVIVTEDSLESVLTGIPIDALREVRDAIKNLDNVPELMRREMILQLRNQHSTHTSITNLSSTSNTDSFTTTDLRSLSLDQYDYEDGEYIDYTGMLLTDLSAYLGFYSMISLKHLNVRHSELTKTCCEVLTKDMGLQTWTFMTSGYKDIIPCQI